ncbi:MAG: divalent-cation tolerance protein CutA [Synechococcus sp.]
MTETSCLVVALTTEGDQGRAEALAEALLERRLVACISLQPQRSMYRWNGRLERGSEVQLLLKTSPCCLDVLRQTVMELHSYDTPEWISWPVDAAPAYGQWALAEISSGGLPQAAGETAGTERPAV